MRAVGSGRDCQFDVRLIVATNRDLEAEVDEGRFRSDLYFRVNVIHVHLPPLRARGADVLTLAQAFLAKFVRHGEVEIRGVTPAAAQRLCDYDWPGNVRELRNCIERACALTRREEIDVVDLPDRIRLQQRTRAVVAASRGALPSLDEVQHRYIHQVLESVGGNKSVAARILGLDRKTLTRRMSPP